MSHYLGSRIMNVGEMEPSKNLWSKCSLHPEESTPFTLNNLSSETLSTSLLGHFFQVVQPVLGDGDLARSVILHRHLQLTFFSMTKLSHGEWCCIKCHGGGHGSLWVRGWWWWQKNPSRESKSIPRIQIYCTDNKPLLPPRVRHTLCDLTPLLSVSVACSLGSVPSCELSVDYIWYWGWLGWALWRHTVCSFPGSAVTHCKRHSGITTQVYFLMVLTELRALAWLSGLCSSCRPWGEYVCPVFKFSSTSFPCTESPSYLFKPSSMKQQKVSPQQWALS